MGEKLSATQEKDNEALEIDPYAVAWTLERKSKVTLDVLVFYRMNSLGLSLFFLFTMEAWRLPLYLFSPRCPQFQGGYLKLSLNQFYS